MSSIVPLSSSYLEPSVELPNNNPPSRTLSHLSSASKCELASSPSLYVTFKVVQLVNQFRRRVRTRKTLSSICDDFERQAARYVDGLLGKGRPRKSIYPDCALRPSQKRKISKRRSGTGKPEARPAAARKVEWLLRTLDKSVTSETHSLSDVAKNHELFVGRKEHLQINHSSWKELLPKLVHVTDLLGSLHRAPSSKAGVKTFAESDEGIDLSFDENSVANLEHLLYCLKQQLIVLLIAELREFVRTHIIECQREQKQHTKELILEFPDGRHPLSTTWPWSIRPSLAVLWGVCWMFYIYYDSHGNMRDTTDNRLIATAQNLREWNSDEESNQPQQTIFQQYQGRQTPNQTPQNRQQYFEGDNNFPRQEIHPHGSPSDQRRQQQTPRTMNPHHSPVMTMTPAQPHSHTFYGGQQMATTHPQFYPASDQASHPVGSSASFQSNNAFAPAAPPAYVSAPPASVDDYSLPEDFHPNFQQQQHYTTSPATYPSGSWMPPNTVQRQQPGDFYPPTVANASSGIPAPSLLTLDIPNLAAQPQDFNNHPSATPLSANSNTSNNYGPTLEPRDYRAHSRPMTHVETPQQLYTTPKSESPVPPSLTAQHSRKRSFGEMAEGEHIHHSRNGSRAGSEVHPQYQPSNPDEDSPGRQRANTTTIQRPDPPTNKDGKFVCNYSQECEGQTFDRKCEWNKHMDKHDRPYRCIHPDCAKLQGFTYSGGLLRHEREVHGKHGGPKTQLMCNYPDCKRKNKGFTRKENLNEHIRRVHSKESQSQVSMKRDGTDISAMAGALQDEGETPSRYSESGFEHDESLVSPTQQPKRRRLNSNNVEDQTEVQLLRSDNAELRAQVAEMAQQMQQLQEMVQAQQQQMHQNAQPQG